ncbi:gamma-aminobutyric acid type B receptor subunit 2-like [Pocillopora verrucosa]|uniref:gamma-aminobutyric acid type B receptor subunit 2-like n=1 Tax=Pocillopora verrucosa TaxID=203993 RepID=UPI00333EE33C
MRSTRIFSTLGILCVVLSLECDANKTELIIGSLEISEDKDKGVQLGITTAIHVAKNSSSLKDFLEKYEIRIISYYTNGNEASSINSATYALRYRKGGFPLLLLGPQTSSEASTVLMIVRFYRKLMVTYLTTTSDDSEGRNPYGFTFAPAQLTYIKAILKIMNHFKWKRFAIVYDFLETQGLYVKNVESLMMNTDSEIIGHEAINTGEVNFRSRNQDIQDKLRKLKDLDSKIFYGAFTGRGASLIFCEVFKMGLFGPDFVWILHPNAGNVDQWALYADVERLKNRSGLCIKEQYQRVAERIFILDENIIYRSDENTTTASGLTLRQIFNTPDVGALSKSQKIRMTIAFDTMWGVMLALKESSKELPLKQNVDNFLGNRTITKTIKLKLRNVSFEGLTGAVSFTKNGETSGILIIRQYQADRRALVPIGEYHIIQDKFVVYDEVKDSLWKGNVE